MVESLCELAPPAYKAVVPIPVAILRVFLLRSGKLTTSTASPFSDFSASTARRFAEQQYQLAFQIVYRIALIIKLVLRFCY
jgi:hypothetical protein